MRSSRRTNLIALTRVLHQSSVLPRRNVPELSKLRTRTCAMHLKRDPEDTDYVEKILPKDIADSEATVCFEDDMMGVSVVHRNLHLE